MPSKQNVLLFALVVALGVTVVAMALHLPPPITPEQYEAAKKAAEKAACNYSPLRCFWNWTTHDPVAFYTFFLALFTGVLGVSTLGLWLKTRNLAGFAAQQARDMKDSLELASAEFRSTHRPRMRLKHSWMIDKTAWRLGGPLEINLDFVNIGSGPARTDKILYESILLEPGQRLPQKPPYDEVPDGPDIRVTRFPSPAIIPSGVTLARAVCDGVILEPEEVRDILWGKRQLFIIGTIEYYALDGDGLRQTAYCRRLTYMSYPPADGDMGRFEIINDPDYEYED